MKNNYSFFMENPSFYPSSAASQHTSAPAVMPRQDAIRGLLALLKLNRGPMSEEEYEKGRDRAFVGSDLEESPKRRGPVSGQEQIPEIGIEEAA